MIWGKNLLTSIIFITFAKNFNAMNRIFVFLTATILCAGILSSCSPKSAEPLRAGTVIRDTIQGTPCCVYLPQNYEARVAKNKEVFPVLYLQHGMYGIEDDWTTQGRLVEIMDSLLQSGEVKEMVVIMPGESFCGIHGGVGSQIQHQRRPFFAGDSRPLDGRFPHDAYIAFPAWRVRVYRPILAGYPSDGESFGI